MITGVTKTISNMMKRLLNTRNIDDHKYRCGECQTDEHLTYIYHESDTVHPLMT